MDGTLHRGRRLVRKLEKHRKCRPPPTAARSSSACARTAWGSSAIRLIEHERVNLLREQQHHRALNATDPSITCRWTSSEEDALASAFPFDTYVFKAMTVERPTAALQARLLHANYLYVKETGAWDQLWVHQSMSGETSARLGVTPRREVVGCHRRALSILRRRWAGARTTMGYGQ